eukprot:14860266-Alexandrium_andersonii.AAC.1
MSASLVGSEMCIRDRGTTAGGALCSRTLLARRERARHADFQTRATTVETFVPQTMPHLTELYGA